MAHNLASSMAGLSIGFLLYVDGRAGPSTRRLEQRNQEALGCIREQGLPSSPGFGLLAQLSILGGQGSYRWSRLGHGTEIDAPCGQDITGKPAFKEDIVVASTQTTCLP